MTSFASYAEEFVSEILKSKWKARRTLRATIPRDRESFQSPTTQYGFAEGIWVQRKVFRLQEFHQELVKR